MPRRSLWKGIFVDAFLTRMKQNKDGVLPPGKKIWSRRSSILPDFVDWSVRIYNGKTFVRRKISENMVGHKFGEFANTKKRKPHKSSNMASDDGESDDDDELQKDLEALKRACYLTGTDSSAMVPASFSDNEDEDENCDEDLNLIRDLQKRFAMVTADDYTDLEPLCSILPGDKGTGEDFEDDLETLRAIQRRFAAYGADGEFDSPDHGDTASLEHLETANNLVKSFNAEEDHSYVGLETAYETVKSSSAEEDLSYLGLENTNDLIKSHNAEEDWGYVERTSNSLGYNKGVPDSSDAAGLPIKGSSFPKAASAFVDAIKQNRSCQKLMRSKLMHVESRIEELKELKARVKILKDFQVACTRRTGRALSQKKDVRAQLISMSKMNDSSKLNEKKASPMLYGPIENPQVSKFREVVEKSTTLMDRAKWSKEENERLANGLKQLFQEMLLQRSLGLISDGEGIVDGIVESISDVDVTPDKLRQFLPKVNWNYLASIYVPDRSGAECQTRWLNWEDPLINKNPWTPREDKTILHAIQKGLRNWIDIAMSLGTNRTPFQCLARYQRSLNASMLKREWTEEDDNQLRAAVETYGESNWQIVASVMEGRTGTQCSNRWLKTLHPARQRIGRWTVDEDKRLKVAATFFGPKNWKKIAKFVPGRTQVQCRERWVNSVDPTLNLNTWTEEEDSKLQEAIEKYGYCWSKVAACVLPRTDSQCRRRWKVLLPDHVPLLRAAREVQKVALISNFVDRESERPALYPNDFVPSRAIICVPESESVNPPKKRNRGLRQRRGDAIANSSSGYQYSMVASGLLSGTEGGTVTNNVATKKKRKEKNSKKTKSGRQDGGSDLVHSNSIAYSDVNTVFGYTSDERAKEPFFGQEEGAFDWVESNLYPFSDVNTSLIPVSEAVLEMNRDEESAKQVSGLYMNNGCTYKQRDEGGDSGITKQPQPSPTFTSLLMTPYMEEFDQLDTSFGEGDKVDIDNRTESFHIEQRDEGENFGITEQPHPSPTFTCLLMTPYMEEFEQLDTNFGEVDKVDIDDRTESFHTELLPSGFEFNNQQSGKTGDGDDVFVQKGKWEAKPRRSFVRGCKTKMRSRKSAQIVSEDAVDDDSTLAAFCQERSAVNDDKGTAVAKNEEDDVPLAPFCKKRFAVAEIEDDNSTLAAFCKKISASFNKKRTAVAETGEDMPASFCKKRFAVADSGEDDDETLASFCSKLMRKKRRVG